MCLKIRIFVQFFTQFIESPPFFEDLGKAKYMLEKLEAINQRWKDVEAELSNPEVMSDMKRYAQLNKEYKDLAKVVDEYNIYRNIMSNIDANKEILATEK